MNLDAQLHDLLTAALRARIAPGAEISAWVELPMPGVGYSGAQVRRFEVQYSAGAEHTGRMTWVVKSASLAERRTLAHLARQGHASIPYCCVLDLEQDAPAPLCMQFIAGAAGDLNDADLAQAAQALAAIHARNLRDPGLRAWLPPADGAFIQSGYVLATFRACWAQALQDTDFQAEFGGYTTALEAAAQLFVRVVEEIWQAGDSTTLIHGDLHDGNVIVEAGQPYFIDWDHARCGSFYFDLPNLFPGESVRAYYQALLNCGVALDEQQFFARYREMGRYVGFKYLGFTLAKWAQRDQPGSQVRAWLQNLLGLALNGS